MKINNMASLKDVLKNVEVEGVKLTAKQKDEFLQKFHEELVKVVETGEKVRTDLGTFLKKEKKGRHIAARTMVHPVTKKPIEIKEQDTPDKTVLALKSKIEY